MKKTRTRRNKDPDGLTDRQRAFVEEYLIDFIGYRAAIRAGYSPRSADSEATRLLLNAKVSRALDKAKAERSRRTGITADRVLNELGLIAFQDAGNFLDISEDGLPRLNLKKKTAEGLTRLIKKITQQTWVERTGLDEAGKPVLEPVKEVTVEFYAKDTALRDLIDHLGLKPPREVILKKKVDETLDKLLDRLQQNLPREDYERILEILGAEGQGSEAEVKIG